VLRALSRSKAFVYLTASTLSAVTIIKMTMGQIIVTPITGQTGKAEASQEAPSLSPVALCRVTAYGAEASRGGQRGRGKR
jgi:hypothetical protein